MNELTYIRSGDYWIPKRSLEARLEKLQANDKKDDVVTFEELGVDRLFVDEAHSYKNLFLYTKMQNVAGLSTSDAQKSSDMFAKCRYMDELTGGRGVIFATGTPVSNSMTELYTMQDELDMIHKKMAQYGTSNLSAFLRKMSIDGYVVKLELPELKEMVSLLRYSSNNLNQLTKRVHETGRIYDADLEDLRQSHERLWDAARNILTALAKLN